MPSQSPPPPKPRSRSPRRFRSRSPDRRNPEPNRSRSPQRKSKPTSSGFRWKDKARQDDRNDDQDFRRGDRDSYVSSRYRRDRTPPRRDFNQDRNREARPRDRPARDDDDDRGGRKDRWDNKGKHRSRDDRAGEKKDSSEHKSKAPPKTAGGGEAYIIVTVNDRLGTKAQIPCLASDPVKLFKAQVAARIGRQPHEIMLKRQGERPFKDQLTLEDYGVSSGVQLDLELNTGD